MSLIYQKSLRLSNKSVGRSVNLVSHDCEAIGENFSFQKILIPYIFFYR